MSEDRTRNLVPISFAADINPPTNIKRFTPDTEVSFISMSQVSEEGHITRKSQRRLSEVRNGFSSFLEGDILFAKITPCMENGKGALALNLNHGVGFGSTEFHIIRSHEGTSNKYIYHWLQSQRLRKKAEAFMIGSAGQQRVQSNFFDNFLIPLPPIEEQERIAEVLDTIDEVIQKTEAVIAKLQQVKQGLLHDLLTRGFNEKGQLRDPQRHPEHFKPSPLGLLPSSWTVGIVENFMDIDNTKRKPISALLRHRMKGSFPYYGPTGILDFINQFQFNGLFVTIGEDGDHFLKFSYQNMTQLIEGKFNVNNHAHVLHGIANCKSEWFHLFFKHRDITFYLTRQGAGRYKLNKKTLLALPFAVPTRAEQEEIILRINNKELLINAEKAKLAKLQQVKKGLMDDLLSGRVRT
jgi:type I restriction enzyme S subunit